MPFNAHHVPSTRIGQCAELWLLFFEVQWAANCWRCVLTPFLHLSPLAIGRTYPSSTYVSSKSSVIFLCFDCDTARFVSGPLNSMVETWRLDIRKPISYDRTSQNTKLSSAKYLGNFPMRARVFPGCKMVAPSVLKFPVCLFLANSTMFF